MSEIPGSGNRQAWSRDNDGRAKGDVELHGRRAEFRDALREEIEAASRAAAAGGVPLVNGRLVKRSAEAWQYAFTIENALSVPDDAPGDLYVPALGKRLEAVIVSVQGLAITVSVSEGLGDFVGFAKLSSNLTHLMRKLIGRIEDGAEGENAAGDRLLDRPAGSGSPATDIPAEISKLNAGQLAAVASTVGRDTTFIWGPPGTGKTLTIGAIGEALYRQERSLLLVSHTNSAVDQALLKIADALGDQLRDGSVLRVGDPKDLVLASRDDLLLGPQVERRSAELVARRDELHTERRPLAERVAELQRLIDIIEWIPDAEPALAAWRELLSALRGLERRRDDAEERLRELRAAEPEWAARREAAQVAYQHQQTIERFADDEPRRLAELDTAKADREAAHQRASAAAEELVTAERTEPLRQRLAELPALGLARESASTTSEAHVQARAGAEEARAAAEQAQALLDETERVGGLRRRFRGLPDPEDQRQVVAAASTDADRARAVAGKAQADVETALTTLDEVQQLTAELEPLAGIPRLREAGDQARSAQEQAETAATRAQRLADQLERLRVSTDTARRELGTYRAAHGEPLDVQAECAHYDLELTRARERARMLATEAATTRASLTDELASPAAAVVQWTLASAPAQPTAELRVTAVEQALVAAHEIAANYGVGDLRDELRPLTERLRLIDRELTAIQEALEHIEDTVIAEARIVATTLTRAYLRDSIQARRFDTVILDEASMAPIPALWVAAWLADRAVAVVGDPKQLPPIALAADDDQDKPATKWLGRDVFDAAGVTDAADRGEPPASLIQLTEQYRMHPAISAIPNELAYRGALVNGPGTSDDGELDDFYDRGWGYDHPVLLVDTGDVDAWNTTVDSGGRTSRVNFLSATIAADLAGRLLLDDRPEHRPGGTPRILIATPYRPQARLLTILLRERGLHGEVVAGTAHTFQGSEAPIVIFDTVIDEPHWKVGLFIPALDDTNRRLLNVAISRARRRLVLLGDLDYLIRNGKKAVLGQMLQRLVDGGTPRVNAADVVATGLAARSAVSSSVIFGDVSAADAQSVVMTQDDYFAHLNGDLDAATNRCVLYSPFLTRNGLARAEPHLRAAVDRGVPAYVFTKAHADRKASELAEVRQLEDALTRWGVTVIHKRRMHEKVVLIDDDVVWLGSLNTLSFSDTQELMTRFRSAALFGDLSTALRLDEVLGVYDSAADDERASCPICNTPLETAEGDRGPYLHCPNDECSYTRSMNAPALRNGLIVCRSCGEPVEFHVTDKRGAVWRCTDNRRHHQPVARTHLKLPKMRELLTRKQLRALCKELGLNYGELIGKPANGGARPPTGEPVQMSFAAEDEQPTPEAV